MPTAPGRHPRITTQSRPVTVPLRVSAQQAVRIVVLASDQTLEVRAVHRMAGMNR